MMNPGISLHPDQSRLSLGDPYLRLQLDPQTTAAWPLEYVQQTQVVPAQRISLIPNMPDPVLGLINLRSRVFWAVNLAQMLDLQALDLDVQQYHLVVIQVENVALGLVVQEVKGIVRFSVDSIQPPVGTAAPSLVPYLTGCVLRQGKCLLVLDAAAVANSPILQSKN